MTAVGEPIIVDLDTSIRRRTFEVKVPDGPVVTQRSGRRIKVTRIVGGFTCDAAGHRTGDIKVEVYGETIKGQEWSGDWSEERIRPNTADHRTVIEDATQVVLAYI